MPDLPTFSDAADAASEAVDRHGRTLLPWLPDPPTCECGALRYAATTFDWRQAAYVASWECRECDAADTYREPVYEDALQDGPREGSSVIRDLIGP